MINIENIANRTLNNLDKINIIMGKNGCGKSMLMREVRNNLPTEEYGSLKYISPERGGALIYAPNIEQSLSNQNWIHSTRDRNQTENFKQQTVAQFRKLETLILRAYEQDSHNPKFASIIQKVNNLLGNLEIKREGATFKIYATDGTEIQPQSISSGESELIALAIECLIFKQEKIANKPNILFLDEPDVHLHPDLQVKLMQFLADLASDSEDIKIVISTHSTAVLGAFDDYGGVRVCFMKNRQNVLDFEEVSSMYKKILPIFGAHPLSNVFNQSPILIVEGEDDVRIWQQVVRSSGGRIKLYPCEAGSKSEIGEMETDSQNIIDSVYDSARGYSLRDRDDDPDEDIADMGSIIRFRLSCRNAESLILSNEVLAKMNTNWEEMRQKIDNWILNEESKPEGEKHPHLEEFQKFRDAGYDRKNFDLKEIRNDLMYLAGSNKPWEVAVGQALAENYNNARSLLQADGSAFNFLGGKLVNQIFV